MVDFNDELLAKWLRQPLTHEACDDVGRATAGRESNDQPNRLRGIGLRPCNTRHGRDRGSDRGQMQKLSSVGKFHF